jgi:hypothetical protein
MKGRGNKPSPVVKAGGRLLRIAGSSVSHSLRPNFSAQGFPWMASSNAGIGTKLTKSGPQRASAGVPVAGLRYPRSVAAFPGMLEHDRKRAGWWGGPAAWWRCWSDGEAEDQRHHEDERRHPDEKGALFCFGSERVPLISFTLHFSFAFHCLSDTPKGDVGI